MLPRIQLLSKTAARYHVWPFKTLPRLQLKKDKLYCFVRLTHHLIASQYKRKNNRLKYSLKACSTPKKKA